MRLSAVNTRLLKLALSLPPAVLRFLSGGGVVYSQDQTLAPQIQALWRGLFTRPSGSTPLSLSEKSLETVREEWMDAAALFGLPDDIRVHFETLNETGAPAGLLIRPERISEDAPLMVFYHQGGGVLGGPDLSRAFCALLAHVAHGPVFLPEYRLAPIHRFPAGLEDARAAFDWTQINASRLGAKSNRVAIGGILTGAGMALRISMDLQTERKALPVGQLLVTPLLDLVKTGPTPGLWPLTLTDLNQMIDHYAGAGTDLTDPRLSPARVNDVSGLPPTFIISAGIDPLAALAETFARRLRTALVPTLYRRYDSLPLGFDLFTGVVTEAQQATRAIAVTWVDLLRNGPADAA